jgi:hypothetical protein
MHTRANYATVGVGAQLAPEDEDLALDWAADAGDVTADHEFEVTTGDPRDAFVGIQAFDVGTYGHEVVVNDEPLSGFDLPPAAGWQYWVDTVTGTALVEGTNTLRIARDTASDDAFAVGTVFVHWTEAVGGADPAPE